MEDGKHVLDRDRCRLCGVCAEGCYARALEVIGRSMTVESVLEEVLRDRPFYETSGGGMTLSGGEPLVQYEFSLALLQQAGREGLHRAVESCGYGAWSRLKRLSAHAELVLYDIKVVDDTLHRACTGVSNRLILSNLRRLHEAGVNLRIRVPVVPGLNDRPEHFRALAQMAQSLPRIEGLELMPYHRLGEGKRARIGVPENETAMFEAPDPETVDQWLDTLNSLGVTVLNERTVQPKDGRS